MEEKSVNLLNKETELPEAIIHHIMSFLTVKQAVKASVLSKTWFKAWHTNLVFDFDDEFFEKDLFYVGGSSNRFESVTEELGRIRENILKFLDSTLRNREKQTDKYIHKLRINLSLFYEYDFKDLKALMDKWVCHAIESNVKDVKLTFSRHGEKYILPQSLFSAKSIRVLELTRCRLELPRNRVELCSLRNLSLKESNVSDGVIESLIAGCPSIEDVRLDRCYGLSRMEIGGNVQSVSICSYCPSKIDRVSCQTLKSLILDGPILDESLLNQISELNQLEHLSLCCEGRSRNIRISSRCLKTLKIHRISGLKSIKIETPNLCEFTYQGQIIPLSSNALFLSKADICIFYNKKFVNTAEFIRFLDIFCHSNVVSIGVGCKVEDYEFIPVALRETRPSPLFGVKHLNFNLDMLHGYMDFPIVRIVDGLLWIAPHVETVSIDCGRYYNSCFTFSYKKHLAADCCTSLPVSCWQHCIKEVEIVNSRTREKRKIVKRYLLQEEDICEKIAALKDIMIS